jgi:hypothetical protein
MALLAIRLKLLSESFLAADSVLAVLALVVAIIIEAVEVLLPNLRIDLMRLCASSCNISCWGFSTVLGFSTAILVWAASTATGDIENSLHLP